MALDEPRENDNKFTIDGFDFLVDKELHEKAQPIKVDFTGFGFKIDCEMQFQSTDGGCSGCGTNKDGCH
jgi:hypothetical protein